MEGPTAPLAQDRTRRPRRPRQPQETPQERPRPSPAQRGGHPASPRERAIPMVTTTRTASMGEGDYCVGRSLGRLLRMPPWRRWPPFALTAGRRRTCCAPRWRATRSRGGIAGSEARKHGSGSSRPPCPRRPAEACKQQQVLRQPPWPRTLTAIASGARPRSGHRLPR